MNKRQLIIYLTLIFLAGCSKPELGSFQVKTGGGGQCDAKKARYHHVDRDIRVKDYFGFMDSLTAYYDRILSYPINEYYLVRANPWLIDTLAHTDYYYQKNVTDSFTKRPLVFLKKNPYIIKLRLA